MLRRELATARTREFVDPLCGVFNRRALDLLAPKGRLHARFGAVILVDIDDFRSINTACGHQGGDAVLRAVAEKITSAVRGWRRGGMHIRRDCDAVIRCGKDEFLILLRKAPAPAAHNRADQILAAVRSLNIAGTEVTCSLGLALVNGESSLAELIAAADRVLYKAKADGKNQIIAV